jgi:hypothetical protein
MLGLLELIFVKFSMVEPWAVTRSRKAKAVSRSDRGIDETL